jgi:hypothetical protein
LRQRPVNESNELSEDEEDGDEDDTGRRAGQSKPQDAKVQEDDGVEMSSSDQEQEPVTNPVHLFKEEED